MEVIKFLDKNYINYRAYDHPAIFTVQDGEKFCEHIPGSRFKSLLLTNEKKDSLVMYVIEANKQADLKKLASFLYWKKVQFANSETVFNVLSVLPGSVSPFGLLNDKNLKVSLLIDQAVIDSAILNFHPNDNTKTISLSVNEFLKFLKLINKDYILL